MLSQLPQELAAGIVPAVEMFEGTPCWCWLGKHRKQDGRPIEGKEYVYRKTYQRLRGKLTRRVVLHHRCEHTWCINPWHVEPMTQSKHMQSHGWGGDWGQAGKTHCPAGHLYSEENTYHWQNERQCRLCRQEAKLRFRQRHQIS